MAFYSGRGLRTYVDVKYTELVSALANMLWYVNSSVNFFLYILTGTRSGRSSWPVSYTHLTLPTRRTV